MALMGKPGEVAKTSRKRWIGEKGGEGHCSRDAPEKRKNYQLIYSCESDEGGKASGFKKRLFWEGIPQKEKRAEPLKRMQRCNMRKKKSLTLNESALL